MLWTAVKARGLQNARARKNTGRKKRSKRKKTTAERGRERGRERWRWQRVVGEGRSVVVEVEGRGQGKPWDGAVAWSVAVRVGVTYEAYEVSLFLVPSAGRMRCVCLLRRAVRPVRAVSYGMYRRDRMQTRQAAVARRDRLSRRAGALLPMMYERGARRLRRAWHSSIDPIESTDHPRTASRTRVDVTGISRGSLRWGLQNTISRSSSTKRFHDDPASWDRMSNIFAFYTQSHPGSLRFATPDSSGRHPS